MKNFVELIIFEKRKRKTLLRVVLAHRVVKTTVKLSLSWVLEQWLSIFDTGAVLRVHTPDLITPGWGTSIEWSQTLSAFTR